MKKLVLNQRQVRWSIFLSRFNYFIQYCRGKLGLKPDALTSTSGDLHVKRDARLLNQSQIIITMENRRLQLLSVIRPEPSKPDCVLLPTDVLQPPSVLASSNLLPIYSELLGEICSAYQKDLVPSRILSPSGNSERGIK